MGRGERQTDRDRDRESTVFETEMRIEFVASFTLTPGQPLATSGN